MRKICNFIALSASAFPCAVAAQDVVVVPGDDVLWIADEPERTIVVTGAPLNTASLPVSFDRLTSADIDRLQVVSIADALATLPGVSVARNGPVGGFTGVRIRGADAAQTLVVIDGVRVSDPTSPGGGFDFGSLLAGNIAHVDILRGSNSVVWGSDAIGGVVLVNTGGANRIAAEYGSNDSRLANGNFSHDIGALTLTGGAGYYETDGISAADGGIERDGFRQYRGNGRIILDLTNSIRASASMIYADSRLSIDGFALPTFTFGDTDDSQQLNEFYAAAMLEQNVGLFRHRLTFALADINRDTLNSGGVVTFAARGRTERIGWQGEWGNTTDQLHVVGGVEHEWSRARTANGFSGDSGSTGTTGVYATAALEPFRGIRVGIGGRFDDHDDFGSNTSVSANALVDVTAGLSLRAGYSEGFKAPTLFQLSSTTNGFGNPELSPEESAAFDIGFIYRNSERRLGSVPIGLRIEASVFRRDSRNLIDFVGCTGPSAPPICAAGMRPFGTYANVDRARAQGAEIDATFWPTSGLTVHAGYAYVATRDNSVGQATFGNRLARRPLHTVIASIDYAPSGAGVSVGAEVRLVSDSFDDAQNRTRLDGYALVALRSAVKIGERIELYGRLENLFDAQYANVAGYSTYGRTVHAGVRLRL